jgi:hypothetical protein
MEFSIEFYGIFHKHLTEFSLYFPMEFHGKFHGIPWNSMEFDGI